MALSPKYVENFIYFYLSSSWMRLNLLRYYLSAILAGFSVLVWSYYATMVRLALMSLG